MAREMFSKLCGATKISGGYRYTCSQLVGHYDTHRGKSDTGKSELIWGHDKSDSMAWAVYIAHLPDDRAVVEVWSGSGWKRVSTPMTLPQAITMYDNLKNALMYHRKSERESILFKLRAAFKTINASVVLLANQLGERLE